MQESNLRVVDFSRVLAGPFCTQMLADMGADVIKVESPKGDENRQWPPILPSGHSCNFASVNRGKRSLTLNLKSPDAAAIVEKLVQWADVVIHSFLPDTASRLGLDYERFKAINPRVIFCSISGYGEKGELANKPGYDLMVQAFSGAMSTTGYEGGPPTRIGVSYIDMSTGLSAYGGILTAVLRRLSTGEGAHVRVSLLETSVALLGYHALSWLQAGVLPKKQGSGGVYQVPYQAFRTSDGHVLAGAPNERAWSRLCTILGLPHLLEDDRFKTNVGRVKHRDEVIPLLETAFATNTTAHWVELLEKAGVAVAPIQTINQVLSHPQVLANDMVVSTVDAQGNETPGVGMPFKIGQQSRTASTPAPALGADNSQILTDVLGYDEAAVSELTRNGTI